MRVLGARASVGTVRFGGDMAGCREAVAAEHRRPLRWVTWYQPTPSWRGPLKSSLAVAPCSRAAAMNASHAVGLYRGTLTPSAPPAPWHADPPRAFASAPRKYRLSSS